MIELEPLFDELKKAQPGAELDLIERAYRFSEARHRGQQRASGEPYLSHPLEVARLLASFKMDTVTVTAGLLHDVLEDTPTTKQDLERDFGREIAELVDGVTKLGKLAFSSREERQAENFRKMLVAMARDLRVLLIKLADRLHNMRTLDYLPTEKGRKIAQETLDIYAPLAHRLGMAKVKAELEDLALRSLQPDAYQELQKRVAKRRLEREVDINHVIAIIERKLTEVGIESQIRGRPKHFFSIWKKMHDQGREFEGIYDLTAVRVITASVRDCYAALGVIHSLWKPVPGRFKDFIAMPKVNMYQSLHTTVIGPKGEPVEIQIRTPEMHRIAEDGIAAHWLYKEKKTGKGKDKVDESLVWLRQLMEAQQDTADPKEFLDNVRVDLFPDEVYVFTPKGDVKALPDGATPIDFAYTVHTQVGEHCVGAKVNGKLVPLRTTLKQGDIVEVVTSPNQHPSRDWLKFVKSSRARNKINQWLKVQERARSIELGREIFEREAKKYRLNVSTLLDGDEMKKLATDLGLPGVDDVLANIGYGRSSVQQVLTKVAPNAVLEAPEKPRPAATRPKAEQGVRIRGVDDLLVRFAKCCNPLPGDQIVGFITRGRGLTAHTRDCLTVVKSVLDRERLIDVEWDVEEPATRPVRIAVYIGRDRPGLLTEITGAISSRNGNITKAEVVVTDDRRGTNNFVIEVADLRQLQDIMGAIRDVPDVVNVERVRGL